MDIVKSILENIFPEDSAKYFQIFKANEITDESFKLLTVDDINALIPDQNARDKIIGTFADVFTTDSFTWPREPKPDGQGQSSNSKSKTDRMRIDSAFSDSDGSEPEPELLPKRTKKNDGDGELNGGGSSSNNGNSNGGVHKVPEEILQKRIVNHKTQYLIKWKGKKKVISWEWSYDEKLEGYQYMIRDFEREQEKVVDNEDCKIVDDEKPGPSGSKRRKGPNPTHKDNRGQGSNEKIDEDYNNYDFEDNGEIAYVVEAILDKKKAGRRWEFLIKWQGYPDSDNSWEPRTNLKQCQEMLKTFEAVWKANNQNQDDDDDGNETRTTNSRPQNHQNKEVRGKDTRNDNQTKNQKTLEEKREGRKVNSFYKSLKLVSDQDESIQKARTKAIRRPQAMPESPGHRLGGGGATSKATETNKNDTKNQPKKKTYKNIMDLSSSSTSDDENENDNRKMNKKKSKVKKGSGSGNGNGKAKESNANINSVNSASATQNINGPSHHENANENNLPNPHHNNMNGVVEFPMFEETDDEIEILEGQSPLVSVIKTENNPAEESVDPTQSITVPDIYSNLSMDYQNLDDDSN